MIENTFCLFDWVEYNGKQGIVVNADVLGVYKILINEGEIDKEYTVKKYELRPIELTQEILELNGYKTDDDAFWYSNIDGSPQLTAEEDDSGEMVNWEDNGIFLDYVSDFQQLLRLKFLPDFANNFKIK